MLISFTTTSISELDDRPPTQDKPKTKQHQKHRAANNNNLSNPKTQHIAQAAKKNQRVHLSSSLSSTASTPKTVSASASPRAIEQKPSQKPKNTLFDQNEDQPKSKISRPKTSEQNDTRLPPFRAQALVKTGYFHLNQLLQSTSEVFRAWAFISQGFNIDTVFNLEDSLVLGVSLNYFHLSNDQTMFDKYTILASSVSVWAPTVYLKKRFYIEDWFELKPTIALTLNSLIHFAFTSNTSTTLSKSPILDTTIGLTSRLHLESYYLISILLGVGTTIQSFDSSIVITNLPLKGVFKVGFEHLVLKNFGFIFETGLNLERYDNLAITSDSWNQFLLVWNVGLGLQFIF